MCMVPRLRRDADLRKHGLPDCAGGGSQGGWQRLQAQQRLGSLRPVEKHLQVPRC